MAFLKSRRNSRKLALTCVRAEVRELHYVFRLDRAGTVVQDRQKRLVIGREHPEEKDIAEFKQQLYQCHLSLYEEKGCH